MIKDNKHCHHTTSAYALNARLKATTLKAGLQPTTLKAGLQGSHSISDHARLSHLDFLESGHKGFAGIQFGTTAEWDEDRTYRPVEGMLVVYTDYQSYEEEGQIIYVPGFKIGNGNTYLLDLPFVGEADSRLLQEHIENTEVHIQPGERELWNNKLNYVEPGSDLLEFTRD